MHRIYDCVISDEELDRLAAVFIPAPDAYYFYDDQLLRPLLSRGIAVYTREELHSSFPTFGLLYGAVYTSWRIPQDVYVTLMNHRQLATLDQSLRQRLFEQQVQHGRGHVYNVDWLDEFEVPPDNRVDVEGKWHYLLTSHDWQSFPTETRRQWILKWLAECRKGEPQGVSDVPCDNVRIPYALVRDYAGRFAEHCGPNCFAAAIAMVVGQTSESESRTLIQQWLQHEPFFRLLDAQRYSEFGQYHAVSDLQIQPADVLVWHTADGTAAHAGFAVSDRFIFQKHGQGFQDPWQVLRMEDVWYNKYLATGGWITVYRS